MSFMEDPFERWMLPGMSPFSGMRAGPSFPIDVQEKGNEYIVYAALPGVNPQKVNIQAQNNTLRISGDIPEEKPEEPGQWLLLERPTGHFERTVTFPSNIATGQAQAEFRNGMLVIELPKTPAGREIPIGTGEQRQQAIQPGQQAQYQSQSTAQQAPPINVGAEQGGHLQEAMPMGPGQGTGEQIGTMSGAAPAGQAYEPGSQVRAGMTVYGTNGNEVGLVKEVRSNDFLVNRSFQRDIYVPFNAVQTVRNDQVVLTIPADAVDTMNWPNPPTFG